MGLHNRSYMGTGSGRPYSGKVDDGKQMLWGLIWANVIVFVLCSRAFMPGLYDLLGLSAEGIRHFKLYQLITAGFVHSGFGHIFFNMWGLWIFGGLAAPRLGGKRFLALYLIGALAGNLLFLLFNWHDSFRLVGASGAVFAVMVAAALLEPNRQFVMIFMPMFPLKTTTLVVVYTVIELLVMTTGTDDGVAHLAHLGGALGGYLFLKMVFGRTLPWDPFRRGGIKWNKNPRVEPEPKWQPPPAGGGGRVSSHELDALLDKVSRTGINSLSEYELQRLRQAREEMRGN